VSAGVPLSAVAASIAVPASGVGVAAPGAGYGDQQKLPGDTRSDRQMNGAVQSALVVHVRMHSFRRSFEVWFGTHASPVGQSVPASQFCVQ
jgi:hypothetical protein